MGDNVEVRTYYTYVMLGLPQAPVRLLYKGRRGENAAQQEMEERTRQTLGVYQYVCSEGAVG